MVQCCMNNSNILKTEWDQKRVEHVVVIDRKDVVITASGQIKSQLGLLQGYVGEKNDQRKQETRANEYKRRKTEENRTYRGFYVFVVLESLTSMSSQSRDPDPYCSRH